MDWINFIIGELDELDEKTKRIQEKSKVRGDLICF